MILEPRAIDLGTRDVAPEIGDRVHVYATPKQGHAHFSRVTRVLAHLPGLDAWEVEIVGINKPARVLLVAQERTGDGLVVGTWRELAGR